MEMTRTTWKAEVSAAIHWNLDAEQFTAAFTWGKTNIFPFSDFLFSDFFV
jgi:hypothetical protein